MSDRIGMILDVDHLKARQAYEKAVNEIERLWPIFMERARIVQDELEREIKEKKLPRKVGPDFVMNCYDDMRKRIVEKMRLAYLAVGPIRMCEKDAIELLGLQDGSIVERFREWPPRPKGGW
jgi:NurA-like 5'-3' nuclease